MMKLWHCFIDLLRVCPRVAYLQSESEYMQEEYQFYRQFVHSISSEGCLTKGI